MALEDMIPYEVRYQLAKVFNTSVSSLTIFNIIDATIAFVLLTYVFYSFMDKIRIFKSVNKSVYWIIAAVMAGSLGLFGGFLFRAAKFVAFIAIAIAMLFKDWTWKKKMRVVFTVWFGLLMFYSIAGDLSINPSFLQFSLGGLAGINVLLADIRFWQKLVLIPIVVVGFLIAWPMVLDLLTGQFRVY